MKTALSLEATKQLFTEARSHHSWLNKPVPKALLQEIYDLTKWGPTAVNANPMRIVYITTEEAKSKLLPHLMGSNVAQVEAAPVTAIIAQDMEFYNELPKLFPQWDARPMFLADESLTEQTAFRNSSLQGGYFMLAARALGLDICPMSGFSNVAVDETFFKGTSLKSNFICTLGYGDYSKLGPRGARLDFDEAVTVL